VVVVVVSGRDAQRTWRCVVDTLNQCTLMQHPNALL